MGSRGAGRAALAVYMRYVLNSVAKWNLGLAIAVPLVNTLAVVSTIYPSLDQLMQLLVSSTSFLYSTFTIVAAYAFASDLSRGTYAVFLSQPLTRRGYVVTWMLATAVAPATAYLLSFVVPFMVMDVKLLASLDPVDFLLLLLEGVSLSMVVFLTGLTSRRPQLVVAIGVFVHMILFYVLSVAYSLVYYSNSPSALIALVYALALVYPFKSKMVLPGLPRYAGIARWAALANLMLSIALVAAALEYAKRKFEVT